MDAKRADRMLVDLDEDDELMEEFSESDLEEGSGTDEEVSSDRAGIFVDRYTYAKTQLFVAIVQRDLDDDDDDDYQQASEGDSSDENQRARSPLAARGRVSSARSARGRTQRGRGSSRGTGRGRSHRRGSSVTATRGGRGGNRGRGRGRAAAHNSFQSMWTTPDHRTPGKPAFKPERSAGLHLPADFSGTREIDFFQLFFSVELVLSIVSFTNCYAHANIVNAHHYGDTHGAWTDTTVPEMFKFLATLMLMGLCKLPKIEDYWSTKPIFSGSWARALIPSRRRFKGLLTFFKVVDHTKEKQDDRLKKVRYLYEHIRKVCHQLYQPRQSVSIDERIVRSKARFVFRQYLPNKPVRWGTEIFAACEAESSYCFDFQIYTGQEINGQTDVGLTQRVLQDLTSDLHKQGYVIHTDNFYTSEKLATALMKDGIQIIGTIKLNRTGVPPMLKSDVKAFEKNAERGTMRYARSNSNNNILYVQWKDRRAVTMLSTVHNACEFVEVERNVKVNGAHQKMQVKQPACIRDYNKGMGGVDVFDQHTAAYRMLRKSNKYWKTIAIDQLEVAVVNSYYFIQHVQSRKPRHHQTSFIV